VSGASAALDAYLTASGKAWKTFLDHRAGRATDHDVARDNRAEANALASLRLAIDALEGAPS